LTDLQKRNNEIYRSRDRKGAVLKPANTITTSKMDENWEVFQGSLVLRIFSILEELT